MYRERWDRDDGVGVLIISPIRELAIQIFDVLCTIGKHHSFSAGLIIGGKDFEVRIIASFHFRTSRSGS